MDVQGDSLETQTSVGPSIKFEKDLVVTSLTQSMEDLWTQSLRNVLSIPPRGAYQKELAPF
jgi:hypothetical protein